MMRKCCGTTYIHVQRMRKQRHHLETMVLHARVESGSLEASSSVSTCKMELDVSNNGPAQIEWQDDDPVQKSHMCSQDPPALSYCLGAV